MSLKRFVVIGGDNESPQLSGGSRELGFELRRLKGGRREGVEQIDVRCGTLRFSIIPTRGMGIWKAHCSDVEFGWQSPVAGPVHPAFVPIDEPSGLGWLDGFDELLARCGLASNGAPDFDATGRLTFPLHGRIANAPAHRVELVIDEERGAIEVHGIVSESRFHFQHLQLSTVYRCRVGETRISIQDTVSNLSALPTTFQLLYHFNFGPPLLEAGTKIVAPVREIAPRDLASANALEHWNSMPPPGSNSSEHVFFLKLFGDPRQQTAVLLHNSRGDLGAVVSFDQRELPCFSLWKNAASLRDGFVVGLEPATNFPNRRGFEEKRGRVVRLGPESNYGIQVELALCCDKESVQKWVGMIAEMQAQPLHQILLPSPEYSPEGESEMSGE